MKVFVTGASGFIGRSTLKELISHGHSVIGLARSDASAAKVEALGGVVHRGSLEDLESLKAAASQADAAIHLGFQHDDFSNEGLMKAQVVDRAAIAAIMEALPGSDAPFITSSGTLLLPNGDGMADEDSKAVDDGSGFAERQKASKLTLDLAKEGKAKGMIVRFAPTVHGPGDWGFMTIAIKGMKAAGEAIYVGDGGVWPAVQVDDAAVLLRLVVEKGRSGGIYHAVGEFNVQMKDVAELVGKKLDLPVVSKQVPQAMEKLGFLGAVLGLKNPTSSEKTQKELGWTPTNLGLLADLEANYL